MARVQQLLKDAEMPQQDTAGVLHVADRPFQTNESFPLVMRVEDMCRAFGIKKSTFYARMKLGAYVRFELSGLGRARWSGAKVQRHLLNVADERRFFGRKSA